MNRRLPSPPRLSLMALMLMAVAACSASPTQAQDFEGTVIRVIDGDTLRVDTLPRRIRLWGVDAAERGEAGSARATQALSALVAGQRIVIEPMGDDRYGRLVARLYLADGRDINRLLIEAGAVREFCRYSHGYYGHCE